MAIITDISKKLSVAPRTLAKYISSAPYRYKVYKIEKRNGSGFREIAQPARELKFLQNYVLNSYFNNLPVHGACAAYIKNKNIRDNAVCHAGKKYFLKMDFQNFFPSITPDDFIKHIDRKLNWENWSEDKEVVSRLFFYAKDRSGNLRLSIGAPTSPFISNTIMYDFDFSIYKMCKERDVRYTRYADDLVFSTNQKNILFDFVKTVENTIKGLQYPVLNINKKKTSFLSKKGNVHVTGLVLTSDGKVSIGRDKKRHIKSLVYQFSKDELSDIDRSYLEGYLSFCWSVDREFIFSLEKKYGVLLINSIRGA